MYLTKRQSQLAGLTIVVLFFTLVFVLMRNNRKPSQVASIPKVHEIPTPSSTPQAGEVHLNEFHRSESKDGRTVWEVHGKEGRYLPGNNAAVLKDAVLYLSRNENERVKLTAGAATLYLQGTSLNRAELSDGVVMEYNGKGTIRTQSAIYALTEERVSSPDEVTITTDTAEVRGRRLVADLSVEHFQLLENVSTTVKPRTME